MGFVDVDWIGSCAWEALFRLRGISTQVCGVLGLPLLLTRGCSWVRSAQEALGYNVPPLAQVASTVATGPRARHPPATFSISDSRSQSASKKDKKSDGGSKKNGNNSQDSRQLNVSGNHPSNMIRYAIVFL